MWRRCRGAGRQRQWWWVRGAATGMAVVGGCTTCEMCWGAGRSWQCVVGPRGGSAGSSMDVIQVMAQRHLYGLDCMIRCVFCLAACPERAPAHPRVTIPACRTALMCRCSSAHPHSDTSPRLDPRAMTHACLRPRATARLSCITANTHLTSDQVPYSVSYMPLPAWPGACAPAPPRFWSRRRGTRCTRAACCAAAGAPTACCTAPGRTAGRCTPQPRVSGGVVR